MFQFLPLRSGHHERMENRRHHLQFFPHRVYIQYILYIESGIFNSFMGSGSQFFNGLRCERERIESIKRGTHVVKRGNPYIPPGRKIGMVIVVYRRVNIVEMYRSFEIKQYEKTLLPRELEIVIESNDTAVRKLEELREIIRKIEKLGFTAKIEIYESDWLSSTIEIRPQITYDKVVIEVVIPKKGELNRIKEQLKTKETLEALNILEKLALEEKQKAIAFLEKLEDIRLVVYIEKRDTDC